MSAVCKLCFYPLRGKREMKEGICRYCLPSNQKFTGEACTSESDNTFSLKGKISPPVDLGISKEQ